jgi:Transglutaminase-like superfamily
LRAASRARRRLRRERLDSVMRALPEVPNVPVSAERGMRAVLARRQDTCLVRAIVRQAWYAAHGEPREMVIGVTAPAPDFQAHAWLEGDPPPREEGFEELMRRAPV